MVRLQPGRTGSLSPALLELAAQASDLEIDSACWQEAVQVSAEALRRLQSSGAVVYGTTTGVGPLVSNAVDAAMESAHAASVLDHLRCGTGQALPGPVVRAAWILRLHTLARGGSGVRPEMVAWMARWLRKGELPAVPDTGSLGASGDLIPLAHLAAGFRDYAAGRGFHLASREALALVNGTSMLTALAVMARQRLARLLLRAEQATGVLAAVLGVRDEFLHPALHAARGHRGQMVSARSIARRRKLLPGLGLRPLQEPYSLRCAPQILGAVREVLLWTGEILRREIDGIDDNPLVTVWEAEPAALHGGNFHGQAAAFAADLLNLAAVKVGALLEGQLQIMLDPSTNGGSPPFLTPSPGVQAGLAGAQLSAAALTAAMRQHMHPTSADHAPTNLGNQDVVSLGHHAALAAHQQTGRLARVLAIHALALRQLAGLRGSTIPFPPGFPTMAPLDKDRPLHPDIEAAAEAFLRPAVPPNTPLPDGEQMP